MNGTGKKFYGSTERCPHCHSVVRTLWWTLLYLPIIPLGSYRFKRAKGKGWNSSLFWARKSHTRWNQIIVTWIIGIICLGLLIGWSIYGKKHGN